VAFIVSIYVQSTLTTSMTRIQIIASKTSSQMSILRRYLVDHSISRELAVRITRNAQHRVAEDKKNITEDNIELLEKVSQPLLVMLRYEISFPYLEVHPLFEQLHNGCASTIRSLCHAGVTTHPVANRDILFVAHEIPQTYRMYFLLDGQLQYRQRDTDEIYVNPPAWFCEAALWLKNWNPVGTAKAVEHCHMLQVDPDQFQKIVVAHHGGSEKPMQYAQAFVDILNSTPQHQMTDVGDPNEANVNECVWRVFGKTPGNDAHCRIEGHENNRSNSRHSSLFKGMQAINALARGAGALPMFLSSHRPRFRSTTGVSTLPHISRDSTASDLPRRSEQDARPSEA